MNTIVTKMNKNILNSICHYVHHLINLHLQPSSVTKFTPINISCCVISCIAQHTILYSYSIVNRSNKRDHVVLLSLRRLSHIFIDLRENGKMERDIFIDLMSSFIVFHIILTVAVGQDIINLWIFIDWKKKLEKYILTRLFYTNFIKYQFNTLYCISVTWNYYFYNF